MQVLNFEFDVKRDITFVFDNIYRPNVFSEWSKSFVPGSHYEGEIIEGDEIRFLDADNNGVGGVVGQIIPNNLLEFITMYNIENGVFTNLEKNGYEQYNFSKIDDNNTHIKVQVAVSDKYAKTTVELWKKAIIEIQNTLEHL